MKQLPDEDRQILGVTVQYLNTRAAWNLYTPAMHHKWTERLKEATVVTTTTSTIVIIIIIVQQYQLCPLSRSLYSLLWHYSSFRQLLVLLGWGGRWLSIPPPLTPSPTAWPLLIQSPPVPYVNYACFCKARG